MIDEEIWQQITDFWVSSGEGQNKYSGPEELRDKYGQYILAAHAELSELLESYPWKPWRPVGYQAIDIENIKREVVDILFFLHHVCALVGVTPEDLKKKFDWVMENNKRRYIDGDFSKEI